MTDSGYLGYLDITFQNGGIPGSSESLQDTGVLSQLTCKAKEKKGGLTVVCLDLANAYGSIPYHLIQVALDH